MNYFANRNNYKDEFDTYIPEATVLDNLYLEENILDYGFGHGYMLRTLNNIGYKNLYGAEINRDMLSKIKLHGITAFDLNEEKITLKFDKIILSHVIEHISKIEIINFLKNIKSLLNHGGSLIITTPNAQSVTGSYWLFADFTHEWLYTTGSLEYILRSAGFNNICHLESKRNYFGKICNFLIQKSIGLINKISKSYYDTRFPNNYNFELIVIAKDE
jgi:2-polyprenyl-3-methyl-5-hydroxy-6-metoxy-1,4-benzoquinol methylase